MSDKAVLFEDCGNYGCITLNLAEKGNTLDRAAQLALQDVLRQCVGKYAAIVLTGAGEAFCTGIEGGDRSEDPASRFSRQGQTWVETVDAIRKHPSVVIAAVRGAALGEGVSLINAC